MWSFTVNLTSQTITAYIQTLMEFEINGENAFRERENGVSYPSLFRAMRILIGYISLPFLIPTVR